MPLKDPQGGLKPLFNKSNSAQRVELIFPAGAEICVTADIAAQLPVEFVPVGDTTKADQANQRAAAAAVEAEETEPAAATPKAKPTPKTHK